MENERRIDINTALAEIAGIEAQLHPTGAVDSEPARLNAIREKVMNGEITPDEAINQARGVLAGRQDYH